MESMLNMEKSLLALSKDDLLEMVNAGLAKISVVDDYMAEFWKQLLPDIELHQDAAVARHVELFLKAAPGAVARAKALLRQVYGRLPENVIPMTTEAIADQRVSAEGQEGLRAFLEKRTPSWQA